MGHGQPSIGGKILLLACMLLLTASISARGDDCNGNGFPDQAEIDHGVAEDCNLNAVPDECDLTAGASFDCNANQVPDECDTASSFDATALDPLISWGIELDSGDIDGDGDRDLAVSEQLFGQPKTWHENVGGGAFARRVIEERGEPGPIRLVDLDQDGDLDLVNAYGDEVVWFENADGLGGFAAPQGLAASEPPIGSYRQMRVIDIDGDGDDDIVTMQSNCGATSTSHVTWYETLDGSPALGPTRFVYSAPFSCLSILEVADLDHDGDGDILLAAGTLLWFENFGGGASFSAPRAIGELSGFVRTVDVDSDGDPDVLSSREWYENLDGAGSFGPAEPVTSIYSFLYGADMDGDGDRDIVSGNSSGDNTLRWHENVDGGGTLGEVHEMFTGSMGGYGPELFDFDGDGDIDAAVTGSSGGPWLLENQSGDCDGDRVPDVCQPDCNASGMGDVCDVRQGHSADCNRNFLPDECDVACPGGCDADGDRCVDPFDCAADDAAVWSEPTPPRSLALRLAASGTLLWNAPAEPGAEIARYDTLRSQHPADFFRATMCVETDGDDTISTDTDLPASGGAFYYLIRAENDCPSGAGSMGAASDGTPRSGRSCP